MLSRWKLLFVCFAFHLNEYKLLFTFDWAIWQLNFSRHGNCHMHAQFHFSYCGKSCQMCFGEFLSTFRVIGPKKVGEHCISLLYMLSLSYSDVTISHILEYLMPHLQLYTLVSFSVRVVSVLHCMRFYRACCQTMLRFVLRLIWWFL